MSTDPHMLMLQNAIAAAKEGRPDEALDTVRDVLDEDEENVRAWLLLARLTPSTDEKRVALSNVLALDPENERARKMLDRLEEQVVGPKGGPEILPGVSRNLVIGIVGGSLLIVLIVAFLLISAENNRQAEQRAAEQDATNAAAQAAAIAQQATDSAAQVTLSAQAANEAATADAVAAAQAADATARVIEGAQTATAVVATGTAAALMTNPPPTATPTPVPPPADLSGRLVGWVGRGNFSDDRQIVQFPLDGSQPQPVGNADGRFPYIFTAQGPEAEGAIYLTYNRDNLAYEVDTTAFSGADLFLSVLADTDIISIALSPDSTRLAYTSVPLGQENSAIFLVDLTAPDLALATQQLTFDATSYTDLTFSPDGQQIAAVRVQPPSQAEGDANAQSDPGGTDLIAINLATGGVPRSLTTDRDALIEAMPRWVTDSSGGQLLFYAARPPGQQEPSHDIYMMLPENPDSGFAVVTGPANDIYPVVSPDGTTLAYASNRRGSYAIFLLNLSTQMTAQLTADGGDDAFPGDWRP